MQDNEQGAGRFSTSPIYTISPSEMKDLIAILNSIGLRPIPSFNDALSYEVGWRDRFLTIERWEGEEIETAHAYDACAVSNMLAKFLIQDLASMQPARQASYFWGACCVFYFQNVSKQSWYTLVYTQQYKRLCLLGYALLPLLLSFKYKAHEIMRWK